jgi:hypothetical protein
VALAEGGVLNGGDVAGGDGRDELGSGSTFWPTPATASTRPTRPRGCFEPVDRPLATHLIEAPIRIDPDARRPGDA